MAIQRDLDPPAELLRHDHFTAEELADLLEMDVGLVRHAAFTGELRAAVVDHHILCIRREDALRWLEARGRRRPRRVDRGHILSAACFRAATEPCSAPTAAARSPRPAEAHDRHFPS